MFTVRPLGAEAGKVVHAEHPPDVAVPTQRPQATEAAVVPGAGLDARVVADVQEGALFVVARVCGGVQKQIYIKNLNLEHKIII